MRGKYVIAGIGHTRYGRLPGRGTVSMNVEACRKALGASNEDVLSGFLGLAKGDVDRLTKEGVI
jgi:hypothetical protein